MFDSASSYSRQVRIRVVQVLTLLRIPLAVGFFLATAFLEATTALWVFLALLILIEGTDMLDGFLARRLDAVTEAGATLDPYADSLSRLTIYSALAYNGYALLVVPYVMAVRDVTVAYARIQFARRGRTVSAKWSGKLKAVVQGLGALSLILSTIAAPSNAPDPLSVLAISWVVVVATALSGATYVRQAFAST